MIDYESSESVEITFSTFVDKIFDVLDQENFSKIQRKCLENLNVVGGLSLPVDVQYEVKETRNLGDLFLVLCCHCRPYWNWMNIRILEKIAGNSLAAKQLIRKYKKEVFSKKVKDVISEISDMDIPAEKYIEVKEKWNKSFDDLLIQDIVKRWCEIEKKLNVEQTMLLKSITAGCVEICWLLRNDLVEHAICSATNSQLAGHDDQSAQELVKEDNQSITVEPIKGGDQSATQDFFPEVFYLKIGNVIIKDNITGKKN